MQNTVAEIAKAFGVNLTGLSKMLGVKPSALSNWRKEGIPDGRKWQLKQLAAEQGIDVEALLSAGPPSPDTASEPTEDAA
jgi:transposase-like protein